VLYKVVSPKDWGLAPCTHDLPQLAALGLNALDLETRARNCTYEWLLNQFDEDAGAFGGYYSAIDDTKAPPQTVNLIAPFQLLAAYDRYGDAALVAKAQRAADWLEAHLVESHPMSLVCGGVRDNIKTQELWVKYTADYVMLNTALWRRGREERYLRRALQSARFIVQAQNFGFATESDEYLGHWRTSGWQSFGRVIEAMLDLHELTGSDEWLQRAIAWGEFGLAQVHPNGCCYLIHGEYYNSDLAADEIRALAFLYEATDRTEFLYGARGFADWHVRTQRPDGAWILNVDQKGNVVSDYVGPGDPPNIAISLLRLHKLTGDPSYITSALKAVVYATKQQVLPGSSHPYADNPNTHWGLWSWSPHYDFTMSGDQSTHFVRGIWFTIDYLASVDQSVWNEMRLDGLMPQPASTAGID
jgi:hypothetical protein